MSIAVWTRTRPLDFPWKRSSDVTVMRLSSSDGASGAGSSSLAPYSSRSAAELPTPTPGDEGRLFLTVAALNAGGLVAPPRRCRSLYHVSLSMCTPSSCVKSASGHSCGRAALSAERHRRKESTHALQERLHLLEAALQAFHISAGTASAALTHTRRSAPLRRTAFLRGKGGSAGDTRSGTGGAHLCGFDIRALEAVRRTIRAFARRRRAVTWTSGGAAIRSAWAGRERGNAAHSVLEGGRYGGCHDSRGRDRGEVAVRTLFAAAGVARSLDSPLLGLCVVARGRLCIVVVTGRHGLYYLRWTIR